jgi:hypothetical protein
MVENMSEVINVKDIQGFVIGHIKGNEVKDIQGYTIGRVGGGEIKDIQGYVIGRVKGDEIKDIQGYTVGRVSGHEIKDIHGYTIGRIDESATYEQACAAGFFFFGLNGKAKNETTPSSVSSSSSSTSGEKPSGCLGMILAFFGFIFMKLPIGGKICAIAGAVLPIIGAIVGGNGNLVIVTPFGFLIGGGIGALGNFIIPKLSKTGKLGTLIGAVVLIIAFEILLFTSNVSTAFGNIVGFAIFGLIIGSILGAIIGSIVGFIQKKAGKKKE